MTSLTHTPAQKTHATTPAEIRVPTSMASWTTTLRRAGGLHAVCKPSLTTTITSSTLPGPSVCHQDQPLPQQPRPRQLQHLVELAPEVY